ncbi:hypothetical protein EVAR_31086_1 [Eumeta japonica]|uniref:Uncharacterized protein n=1 Tax=Eumeta variegata TaxID=151549 RepID=A0A4C1XE99_EUMVA|nr:hypothetical protein EVAR_31086_1 [Eumeta japonica]
MIYTFRLGKPRRRRGGVTRSCFYSGLRDPLFEATVSDSIDLFECLRSGLVHEMDVRCCPLRAVGRAAAPRAAAILSIRPYIMPEAERGCEKCYKRHERLTITKFVTEIDMTVPVFCKLIINSCFAWCFIDKQFEAVRVC